MSKKFSLLRGGRSLINPLVRCLSALKYFITRAFLTLWYQNRPIPLWQYGLLWPLACLFKSIVSLRSWAYKHGWLPQFIAPIPVIIVGNLHCGGTGKTPFVQWLAKFLTAKGYKVGIVLRGYKKLNTHHLYRVSSYTECQEAGDEACILARATLCPVVISRSRVAAVKSLLAHDDCDIIISDDGLQHYALARTFEIVLMNARFIGNGYALPLGPMREPWSRLATVDCVVVNVNDSSPPRVLPMDSALLMTIQPIALISLLRPTELYGLKDFCDQPIHAVAGIAHPQNFFTLLTDLGYTIIPHVFEDHHPFVKDDIDFGPNTRILMTEKDALKCLAFADARHFYIKIKASIEAPGALTLFNALHAKLVKFY
jgi:tetraacyldisaccharide 4'-kinase